MKDQRLQDRIKELKGSLVLLPVNPTFDKVAAALALFLSFKKGGKEATIACPTPMLAGFNHLIGVDKVVDKIGNRNLIISFDYIKDAIEKVSYNVENNKLNLVIEPKEGAPRLDPKKVSYSYTGSNAEVFFLIGVLRFEDLGVFYEDLRRLFKNKIVVDIDNYNNKTPLTEINFTNSEVSSCSELMVNFLKKHQLPVDQDIATNIFLGLENSTGGFRSRVRAETFEAAAWCLRYGARKEYRQVMPITPQPSAGPKPEPAPDWFKPKIYKGTTLA